MVRRGGGGGGGGGGGMCVLNLLLFVTFYSNPPSPFVGFASSMSSGIFDCKILFPPSLYFPTPLLSRFGNAKKKFSEEE